MTEPSPQNPAIIRPEMVLRFPHLLALCAAMPSHGSDLDAIVALRLQGIATAWLTALARVGSHMCCRCGSHWSTPMKRDACPHTTSGGMPIPEQADDMEFETITRWVELARMEA